MKYMRSSLVSLCFVFLYPSSQAQFYYYNYKYYENAVVFEPGVSVGIMNSLTDLGGKKGIGKGFIKDLDWKNTKPAVSIYLAATYKYVVGLRLEASFGAVQAADSVLKHVATSTLGRYERNLSFKSKIRDIQLAFEVHPLFFKYYDNDPPRISPYFVVGLGWFSFDPKTRLDGQWHALHPLRTEGQGFIEYPDRKEYKLNQFNFPLGFGLRYEINPFLNARAELVYRILTTDHLDDVSTNYIDAGLFSKYLPDNLSTHAQQLYARGRELNSSYTPVSGSQRGNPGNKDAYFTVQVKVGWRLISKR